MNDWTSPVDIRPDHLEMVQEILRARLPAGFKVWVFGSRANWTTKDFSDLDLAVEGAASLDHKAIVGLEVAFEESDLPYTVDVVDLNAVNQEFREIVKDQKVLLPPADGRATVRRDWREMPFSQAVQINPTVRLKRGEIYPFVDMASVNADSRSANSAEEREFKGNGSRFQDGDTLMARITPCLENGKIARYCAPNNTKVAHGSTEFIVIRGRPDVTNNDFAYYLTQWEEVRNYAIGQMTGTSGRQRVPVDSLDHLTVPLPPLPEQRAIAHILGTLDDKIELNRRMNQTLEGMARAIFQDWFVDFGPVRAKLEGREPYLPPELWDLFPDRLVDSELGEIPEGWGVGALGDCFNLTMGQSPPSNTYNDSGEGLPFFQGSTDFGARFPENRKYCTAPNRIAERGDTLVSVRAPVGALNMAWGKCCIGRGVASLRHKSGSSSFTYYLAWAMQPEFQQYEQTGTVFGAITRKQFEALRVISPTAELVGKFAKLVLPLEQRFIINESDSRALAAQRDALLPKLVSGAVKVGDETQDMSGRF